MSVVLTVVLSVASRSVSDISVSTVEENSLRAFSAAEAGVEEGLKQFAVSGSIIPVLTPVPLPGGGSYTLTAEQVVPEDNFGSSFIYPRPVKSGEAGTIWFVSHDGNDLRCDLSDPFFGCTTATQFRFCWGNSLAPNDNPQTPAVEISIFYDSTCTSNLSTCAVSDNDYSDVKVSRILYDPFGNRTTQNHMETASQDCNWESSLGFQTPTLQIDGTFGIPADCTDQPGCLLMARMKLLYNTDTSYPVGLRAMADGDPRLPGQGYQIDSTGTSGVSTRQVNVYQTYPEPLDLFDLAIFSGKDLTKN